MTDPFTEADDSIQHAAFKFTSKPVKFTDIINISNRATAVLESARDAMTVPYPRKQPPTYSLLQLAKLCGIDKTRLNYILQQKEHDLPEGKMTGSNNRREFTLAESLQWVRHFMPHGQRPAGTKAKKIAVANFKGGVTKSTTAVSLAQGLSLRGHKVLLIDLDPQATTTIMHGLMPDIEVREEETIMPFIYGDEDDLRYAAKESYWQNVDLIPSNSFVSQADFFLPSLQNRDSSFKFWEVLSAGIEPLLDSYDVVIFDTSPAQSYVTINALMAADALIIPLPPKSMDFASSVQFWNLFSDFGKNFLKRSPELADKQYDFINIAPTLVNNSRGSTTSIKHWMHVAYPGLVIPTEISDASGASNASLSFSTVYNFSNYSNENKAFKKTREECDAFVELVDLQLKNIWNSEVSSNEQSNQAVT